MKLRNLNGAIRKVEGAPLVGMMTPAGYARVPVQKTGLLDALKALYPDPQEETYLELTEDGMLTVTEEGRGRIADQTRAAHEAGTEPFAERDGGHGVEVSDDDELLEDDDDVVTEGDVTAAHNEVLADDELLEDDDDLDSILGG